MINKIEKLLIKSKRCDKIILYKEMYFLLSHQEHQLPECIDRYIMDDIHQIYVKIDIGLSKYGIQLGGGVRKYKKVEVLSNSQIIQFIRDIKLTELGIK